jgi:cell division septal protein FtsQ
MQWKEELPIKLEPSVVEELNNRLQLETRARYQLQKSLKVMQLKYRLLAFALCVSLSGWLLIAVWSLTHSGTWQRHPCRGVPKLEEHPALSAKNLSGQVSTQRSIQRTIVALWEGSSRVERVTVRYFPPKIEVVVLEGKKAYWRRIRPDTPIELYPSKADGGT